MAARDARLASGRIVKRRICETPGSRPSGEFTGGGGSAHSRSARKMAGKWNGVEKGERLFTTDRKSDPSPRRRQPPTSPFRAREQSLSLNPPLSHSPVSIHIPSVTSRYQIEESGLTFQAATSNVISSSLRELIHAMVGKYLFYFRPHVYFR